MKKLILALICLGYTATADAQISGPACPSQSPSDFVIGKETLTISSTALPFTASVYAVAGGPTVKYAIVTVQTDAIRAWADGTSPTAAVGMPKAAGVEFPVCGQINVQRFRAIRQTTDATLVIQYYGSGF